MPSAAQAITSQDDTALTLRHERVHQVRADKSCTARN